MSIETLQRDWRTMMRRLIIMSLKQLIVLQTDL